MDESVGMAPSARSGRAFSPAAIGAAIAALCDEQAYRDEYIAAIAPTRSRVRSSYPELMEKLNAFVGAMPPREIAHCVLVSRKWRQSTGKTDARISIDDAWGQAAAELLGWASEEDLLSAGPDRDEVESREAERQAIITRLRSALRALGAGATDARAVDWVERARAAGMKPHAYLHGGERLLYVQTCDLVVDQVEELDIFREQRELHDAIFDTLERQGCIVID